MEAARRSSERAVVRRLVCAVMLAAAAWPCGALESMLLGQVAELPVTWRIVKRCGSWHAEGRQGYHRVVVGDVYDGAGSEVYVQWVAQATQDRPALVVKTAAIAELNDDHNQFDVSSIDCSTNGPSTVIRARATNEHDDDDRVRDISIRLIDVGRYALKENGGRARRGAPQASSVK